MSGNTYKLKYSGTEIENKLDSLESKQDTLTAGANITISDDNVISATSLGSSSSGDSLYTVNGLAPDADGNFDFTLTNIGAAPTVHQHVVNDITDFSTTMANYSNVDHTHTMVKSLKVGTSTLSGDLTLTGGSNVEVSNLDNTVVLNTIPYTSDAAQSVYNAADLTQQIKFFTGTQAEFDVMTKEANIKYICYIVE